MNPWLGLDRLGFLLVRIFLRLCTRANATPTDISTLSLDPDTPIIYVLRDRSAADAAVTDQTAKKLGLPNVLRGQVIHDTSLNHSYIQLYRQPFGNRRQRVPLTSHRLEKLVETLRHNPQADVQMVPVSVFWGRRPEKESSFWRVLLSDGWSPAGFIKKFFIIVTQGRQLYVQFSRPLSLRTLVDQCDSNELAIRKTSRILRVHFRRQHEAAIGPDLSHRRTLSTTVVDSPNVQAVVREEANKQGVDPEKLNAKARHYVQEMAADYSYTVIRALELFLNWVWNRLYDGVKLYNIDNLNKVATDHEVVYVPCHRSHIDYLLLSFVVYRNGLVPPHIAAGINLNLPIVGSILRRGGAFFMRRSFRDNPLYAAVFSEYLHTITSRGFSIEYFVEGGRSRSGRMLSPKTGMLAMTLRSYLRDSRRPIAFVPVYVGYEKVIEAGSYIGELHGKSKKKESVGGLMKSLSVLRSHFGQVHVNFGEPIKLDQFLDSHYPSWAQETLPEEGAPPWFKHVVNELGQEVVEAINAAAVANPVNLLSLALLATPKHSMDRQQLEQQLALYIALLKNAPYSQDAELATTDPSALIQYGLEHDFLICIEHKLGDVITTDEKTALQMAYIRNNSLHLFVLPGLLCSLVMHAQSMEKDALHRLVALLYPFLRSEYFLHWHPGDDIAKAVDHTLEVLEKQGLILRDGDTLRSAENHSHECDMLMHLAQTVMPSLERFYLTILLLVQYGSGQLTADQLGDLAHQTTQRLSLLYEFNSPEFFDKVVLKNFISQLYTTGLVTKDDIGALCFDDALLALDEEARRVLSPNIREAIQRVTRLTLKS